MLPRDVVEVILRKLPLDLRISLKVPPSAVHVHPEVASFVDSASALARDAYRTHVTKVRVGSRVVDGVTVLLMPGIVLQDVGMPGSKLARGDVFKGVRADESGGLWEYELMDSIDRFVWDDEGRVRPEPVSVTDRFHTCWRAFSESRMTRETHRCLRQRFDPSRLSRRLPHGTPRGLVPVS